MTEVPRLTVAQAAMRLNVKPETVYAYISRGLLSRTRTGSGSTLDALEVEEFARRRRRRTAATARREDGSRHSSRGAPLMVLDTDISHDVDGELYFRGVPVEVLATHHSFEAVARWMWGGPMDDSTTFTAETADVHAAASLVAALPPLATPLDRVGAAVLALGAVDPLRHLSHATPGEVGTAGERLIAGVVGALACARGVRQAPGPDGHHGLAAGIRAAFGPEDGTGTERGSTVGLNAALVLMIDHDLAVSTLAARAAASARATLYGAVSSALGALDSTLHGNASTTAADLITRVLDHGSPERALAESVAGDGRMVPGFGQAMYPDGDPRARILLEVMGRAAPSSTALQAVTALTEVMEARTGLRPNIDLALAALMHQEGMSPETGPALFAVARSVGWIAHALDEYGRTPMRMRPHGRYVGPEPRDAL